MVKRSYFIWFIILPCMIMSIAGVSLFQSARELMQTASSLPNPTETQTDDAFTFALVSITVITCLLVMRYDERLYLRRQRAASGDKTLISYPLAPSPLIDEDIAALPSITLHLRWKNTLLALSGAFVSLSILTFSVGVLFGLALSRFTQTPIDILNLVFDSVSILVILEIFWFTIFFVVREQILSTSATGVWIQYTKRSKKQYLSFSDVRLFGVGFPDYYELSTAYRSTYWVRIHPNSFMSHFYKPSISYDDYNQQMETLLSFIGTKTGLPLYDLCKG